LACFVYTVAGHGRLVDPASRTSAWRFGFGTPVHYNDHEMFCGGFAVQHQVNGGKCGICGDAWNGVRNSELPDGLYAKNLKITKTYSAGQEFTIKVDLTQVHRGYFQFKLCAATTMAREVTQECLDQHTLQILNSPDGVRGNKYDIGNGGTRMYEVRARLPAGMRCNRCLLQWTYTAGNNWGWCPDGTGKLGCGPQEHFRGCADVTIN